MYQGASLEVKTRRFWHLSLAWNGRKEAGDANYTFMDVSNAVGEILLGMYQPKLTERTLRLFDEVIAQGQKSEPDTAHVASVVPLPDRRLWLEAKLTEARQA